MLSAVGNVLLGALILLPTCLAFLWGCRFKKTVQALRPATKGPFPIWTLLLLSAAWIVVALPAHFEQERFVTHAKLVKEGKYRESVDFLVRHAPKDFPPSRRIEPNPYEYRVWNQLPEIMAALKTTDPLWVREMYLNYMEIVFSHSRMGCTPEGMLKMFEALERLPGGKDWLMRVHPSAEDVLGDFRVGDETASSNSALEQLTHIVQRLGIKPRPTNKEEGP